MSFQDRIDSGLDRALQRSTEAGQHAHPARLDSHTDPLIIFSDHHKGARNRADDFEQCEQAYIGALGHYRAAGYRLAVLGDAEELWEEPPGAISRAYAEVFDAEAAFQAVGRYDKYWGNHDEQWRSKLVVERELNDPFGGDPPPVREGACYTVVDRGDVLGTLYLVHGHQGTNNNERWAVFARLAVRWLWRPVQRLTGYSPNTPSRNRDLRRRHNAAMYSWASRQEGLVLITGHTHRPVFGSRSWIDFAERELEMDLVHAFRHHADRELWSRLEKLARRPDWIGSRRSPAYFNSGCCCFPDGSVSGLEIAAGEIRLIRWDTVGGVASRRLLAEASLRELFGRVRAVR